MRARQRMRKKRETKRKREKMCLKQALLSMRRVYKYARKITRAMARVTTRTATCIGAKSNVQGDPFNLNIASTVFDIFDTLKKSWIVLNYKDSFVPHCFPTKVSLTLLKCCTSFAFFFTFEQD